MTIVQIICLLVMAVVIYSMRLKGSDILSPGRIFLILWAFVIFLTEFKFSKYQYTWSLFSWFTLIFSLVSFLAGLYMAFVYFMDKKLLSIEEVRNSARTISVNHLKNLYKATNTLFILYLVSFAAEVVLEGEVPAFSAHLDRSRQEFGVFGLHLIVNFQLIIMFLNLEYIILADKTHRREKFIMWSVFFVTLATFTLLLQRFNYFFGAVMALGLLYYASRALTWKRISLILLVFFGFLGGIQSIRLSQYVSQFMYVISKMKYPREYAIFTEPYMYISMNLENAARASEKIQHYLYSASTFDWVYALFGVKHWMADYFNIDSRPFLVSGYNTFPFYWTYFYDFGVTGIAFFPLLSGLVIGLFYYRMRQTGSLEWIALYSIALAIIVISFFTNPLTMLAFVANFIMLYIVHHFLIRKN